MFDFAWMIISLFKSFGWIVLSFILGLSLPIQIFLSLLLFYFILCFFTSVARGEEKYWVFVISGDMGAGKTRWTQRDIYERDPAKTYIISNDPREWVDWHYSTPEQLYQIIHQLYVYYIDQEKIDVDIILLIDECQLYFNNRDWNKSPEINKKLMLIMTQSRKRNLTFYLLTQRVSNIDLNFRKMVDTLTLYERTGIHSISTEYQPKNDVVDFFGWQKQYWVEDDQQFKVKTRHHFFMSPVFWRWVRKMKRIENMGNATHYIVWRDYNMPEFNLKKELEKKFENYKKEEIRSKFNFKHKIWVVKNCIFHLCRPVRKHKFQYSEEISPVGIKISNAFKHHQIKEVEKTVDDAQNECYVFPPRNLSKLSMLWEVQNLESPLTNLSKWENDPEQMIHLFFKPEN